MAKKKDPQPRGRPKWFNRRHIIEIEEDTQEFLEELADKFIQGKTIGAIGEAAEGILSNPSLAFLVTGGFIAAFAAILGKDQVDTVVNFFGDLQRLHTAEEGPEQREAASDLTEAMRALIRAFSPLGRLTPLP